MDEKTGEYRMDYRLPVEYPPEHLAVIKRDMFSHVCHEAIYPFFASGNRFVAQFKFEESEERFPLGRVLTYRLLLDRYRASDMRVFVPVGSLPDAVYYCLPCAGYTFNNASGHCAACGTPRSGGVR